jgi:serine/threonine protein kinase
MSLPERIGKYEIRRELGKGAMGTVYEGYDPIIERPVAIKTILAEYLTDVQSESAVARFKREAQAGGRLQHPGIVGVYEYGEDEKMAFIVMEFVQGQELRKIMRERGRFELIDVFEVMKQLLAALDYSHKHGVVHRDIKPANLMVQGGELRLIDVFFVQVRPSPWRQAVDLANMMMVLGLGSDASTVYAAALKLFTEDEIAEAFAATRGVASPTQLRSMMKAQGRDLLEEFRGLAPPRPPIAIQRWSIRRAVLTLSVLFGLFLVVGMIISNWNAFA